MRKNTDIILIQLIHGKSVLLAKHLTLARKPSTQDADAGILTCSRPAWALKQVQASHSCTASPYLKTTRDWTRQALYSTTSPAWKYTSLRSSTSNKSIFIGITVLKTGSNDHSTQETEAERAPWVQGQPALHTEFQASQRYPVRVCLK